MLGSRIRERIYDTRMRRTYTAEGKAAILRGYLQDKVSMPELCDEYGIRPGVYYSWQQQRGRHAAAAALGLEAALPGLHPDQGGNPPTTPPTPAKDKV